MSPPDGSVVACVALGSNLGDRGAHIEHAFVALDALPETRLVARSAVVETEPVGPPGQGPYLNAAARLETCLTPRELLAHLLDIEQTRGRDRSNTERWGPRTLDLDLLLYSDRQVDEPGLVVPHPRLAERLFVLVPLTEVAGDLVVPGTGQRVGALLDVLRGKKNPTSESTPGSG